MNAVRRVAGFMMVAVLVLAGCGTSAEEEMLVAWRDEIFEAAGVDLPDGVGYGYRFSERAGRCDDSWFFESEYLLLTGGDGSDPDWDADPIGMAGAFADVIEADATEIELQERLSVRDPSEVSHRRIVWTTERSSNFIIFVAETSYTIRFELTEDCAEAVPFALREARSGFEVVERFGEGTERGCGGTREACDA